MGFVDTHDGVSNLFVAFSTREVRVIEERAIHEAGNKREELRTMVGERYRDLLSAADSILRMRKGSNTLRNGLSCVHRDCAKSAMSQRGKTREYSDIGF